MKANERERLIELIKTNTELTNDDKSKILTLIAEQKKYGLVWEDSEKDLHHHRDFLPSEMVVRLPDVNANNGQIYGKSQQIEYNWREDIL